MTKLSDLRRTTIIEEWRPVVGFEGRYEVSSEGRVRSLDRIVKSASGQTYPRKGKMLKAPAGNHGYPTVSLWDRKACQKLVHVLVLEAFVGPRPDGLEACHWNGVRTDNRVENLRWDTPKANHQDRRRHGTIYQTYITHCPSGHEYTEENIYHYDDRRYCRACRAGGRKIDRRA